MQNRVVIPYRRFGTTYRSRLQGSRNPTRRILSSISLPFKMGQIGCPKMSVRNNHSTLRCIPAEHRFQNYMFRNCCSLNTEHHFPCGTRIPKVRRPHIDREFVFRNMHVISPGKLGDGALPNLQSSHPIHVTILCLVIDL